MHHMLPSFRPMPLGRSREPFCHSDWLFEVKWDGFRALAYIENGECKLVSRNGNTFKSFHNLILALPIECQAKSAVLDGEIVCLDETGCAQFTNLMFHRGEPRFQAFDCLWCDGDDLRYQPLTERKQKLRAIVRRDAESLLYTDHVEAAGEGLFDLVCARDLEGIVAKRKFDPYLPEAGNSWIKIKNRNYSQSIGREKLFDWERAMNPDLQGWDRCASICAQLGGA